jgi:hypothetical protein
MQENRGPKDKKHKVAIYIFANVTLSVSFSGKEKGKRGETKS